MSATEIIQQIKALPPQDLREVAEFVRNAESTESPAVRYASNAEASAAGDAVVAKYSEVFRRLAE